MNNRTRSESILNLTSSIEALLRECKYTIPLAANLAMTKLIQKIRLIAFDMAPEQPANQEFEVYWWCCDEHEWEFVTGVQATNHHDAAKNAAYPDDLFERKIRVCTRGQTDHVYFQSELKRDIKLVLN